MCSVGSVLFVEACCSQWKEKSQSFVYDMHYLWNKKSI